jgi:hypothetical protein
MMIRVLRTGVGAMVALYALAGTALLAPSAALAAGPFMKAERLCESQGGSFQTPGIEHYTCSGVSGISDKQRQAAQRLCENTYKGTFGSGPTYTCSNIPS